jgi:hypothetical protein
MGTINNTQLQKELRDAFKIQQNVDAVPGKFEDRVIPVCEVNPKILTNLKMKAGLLNNGTTATLYTTPTNQDYYLCAVELSTIKDVTSTSLFSAINVIIDGVATAVATIAGFSLTPQSEIVNLSFNNPIKVDRGTAITITNSTNVGNITSRGIIFGFVDENSTN